MSLLSKFRKQIKTRDYKENILEHLCDLLNTKKGYGSYPKDLGLDSYIYLGSNKKIVLQIIADIKDCLQKYEKRVCQIEVDHVPNENPFVVAFVIKCKIDGSACSFHLSFNRQKISYSLEEE